MANVLIQESTMDSIGAAIRTKNGSTTKYKPSEMPPAILAIETGTDTSDATAAANDIVAGQTAYLANGKATGTMPNLDNIDFGGDSTPPERGYTSGANYKSIVDALNAAAANALDVKPLNVTENGTYSEDGTVYSPVVVDVPGAVENATVHVTVAGETSNLSYLILRYITAVEYKDIDGTVFPQNSFANPLLISPEYGVQNSVTIVLPKPSILIIEAHSSTDGEPVITYNATWFGGTYTGPREYMNKYGTIAYYGGSFDVFGEGSELTLTIS